MTLVLTDVTKFGIAMVADSAITTTILFPSGKNIKRVTTGAQKLQVIPYLNAGISFWGAGSIPAMGDSRYPTDVWLQYFIERHADVDSLATFADILSNELQRLPKQIREPTGFHLAGYVQVDEEYLPTVYHIRNVDGNFRGYDLHDFVVGHDYPPNPIEEKSFFLRNGDYGVYALLSGLVDLGNLAVRDELGIEIPHQSLGGRIAYLVPRHSGE